MLARTQGHTVYRIPDSRLYLPVLARLEFTSMEVIYQRLTAQDFDRKTLFFFKCHFYAALNSSHTFRLCRRRAV